MGVFEDIDIVVTLELGSSVAEVDIIVVILMIMTRNLEQSHKKYKNKEKITKSMSQNHEKVTNKPKR